jgi:hypothetical protein
MLKNVLQKEQDTPCTYNVTLRHDRAITFAVEMRYVLHILYVCACVRARARAPCLKYPAWNAHAPYRHLWPVLLYNIFPHYLVNVTIKKILIERKICVLIFSKFLSETFFILTRRERDMIKMSNVRLVKYPLFFFDFNENWIFWTEFLIILEYHISCKSIRGSRVVPCGQTDRRTDMMKLIVAFRNLANAP